MSVAKATAFLVGCAVFAYGVRVDATGIRWAGIALLGAAFSLRFVDKAKRR
jgi:hypothetical protein